MNILRRDIPLMTAFFVGMLLMAQFFVPHEYSRNISQKASEWFTIIQGIVLILGVISVSQVHFRRMTRQEAGWGYSLFFFVGALAMMAAGFYNQGEQGRGNAFDWLYDNTMVPLSATLFSMLAFFIASAAFRTFRMRSLDAGLLLTAAIIVMFGQVPWGDQLTGGYASTLVSWIMNVPNIASTRAIQIGVALGIIATSLKIILGIERSYLGGGE